MSKDDPIIKRRGSLVVVDYEISRGRVAYYVRCEKCGKESRMAESSFLQRNTCRCDSDEARKRPNSHRKWREYPVWNMMKARCGNKKNKSYGNYGGRGIKVCDRWINSFENFITDIGRCPTGKTLDRIDVNGDYCPENCRWVTQKEQCNNKRNTRPVTYQGETMSLARWGRKLGICLLQLRKRYDSGMPFEEAIKFVNTKSGLVGISQRRERDKWIFQMNINGKMRKLGSFATKEDAKVSRDEFLKKWGIEEWANARLARPVVIPGYED